MYVWVLWFLFPRWRWSSAWSLAWCPSVLRRAPTRCGSVHWRCGRWWWGCCPPSSCSCLGSPPRSTWPSPCWPSSPVRSTVYSRFFYCEIIIVCGESSFMDFVNLCPHQCFTKYWIVLYCNATKFSYPWKLHSHKPAKYGQSTNIDPPTNKNDSSEYLCWYKIFGGFWCIFKVTIQTYNVFIKVC